MKATQTDVEYHPITWWAPATTDHAPEIRGVKMNKYSLSFYKWTSLLWIILALVVFCSCSNYARSWNKCYPNERKSTKKAQKNFFNGKKHKPKTPW